jgi:enamine deaminase RidA (YjgF/YER057c/UK114 family)
MGIKRLQTSKRFSEIVIHGETVYLAGQLADDFSGDITEQTRQTLANIDRFLAEAGTDKSMLLSATIYLKDIQQDYAGMNAVWDEWMTVAAPARTTVEARLYHNDVLIEITVTAALAA